jgi:hypothetical protein
MPIRLEDSGELLEHAGHEVTTRAKRMWSGFADFALQDNVLEVAVGLMYVRVALIHLAFFQKQPLPPLFSGVSAIYLPFPLHSSMFLGSQSNLIDIVTELLLLSPLW